MSQVSRSKFKHENFTCTVSRSVSNPSHDKASSHLSGMSRWGRWTLESGLDYGLDYGLDCGLIFGLSFGIDKEGILSMVLDSTTHALHGNKTIWRRLSMSLKFDLEMCRWIGSRTSL